LVKKEGEQIAFPEKRERTSLAAGATNNNNQNTAGQISPTTQKAIDNAFRGDIDLAESEEIPPALAPLFDVADVLEEEKGVNKTLAAKKVLDATEGYSPLPWTWWDYIGKGGTIYVHILNLDMNKTSYQKQEPIKCNITNSNFEFTKKHYTRAAKIANERYKKLDVNLKVVIIFDENAKPLTKEEFIQRKADKKQRAALPKELDAEYNPMDSYMVFDNSEHLQQWQSQLAKDYDADLDKSKKWQNNLQVDLDADNKISMDIRNNIGNSHPNAFFATANTNNFGAYTNNFIQLKEDDIKQKGADELNECISGALAILIEHEIGHSKFAIYAENNGHYYEPSFKVRDEANTSAGHKGNTVMQAAPSYSILLDDKNKYDTYLGYDIYMQTMLQLMHGKHPENHKGEVSNTREFVEVFYADMQSLDKERRVIQNELLKIKDFDSKLNSPEGLELRKMFNRLDRVTSAHFDMLTILNNRIDSKEFIATKQQEKSLKIPKNYDDKTNQLYKIENTPQN
jgi:hypothetical protein